MTQLARTGPARTVDTMHVRCGSSLGVDDHDPTCYVINAMTSPEDSTFPVEANLAGPRTLEYIRGVEYAVVHPDSIVPEIVSTTEPPFACHVKQRAVQVVCKASYKTCFKRKTTKVSPRLYTPLGHAQQYISWLGCFGGFSCFCLRVLVSGCCCAVQYV